MTMTTRMTKAWLAASLAVGLLSAVGAAEARERWLHVRINDAGGEAVKINIPMQLVESVLPMIESKELRDGRLRLDAGDLDGLDLREVLSALRDAPDAKFVTVEGPEQSVQVAKERGYLLVLAEDRDRRGRSTESVSVRMPLAVVEALLSGGGDELDLVAALRTLSQYDGEDLVRIRSDDADVRVWIDSSDSGD